MFVQIGNHAFNPDYINRINFTNEKVFVHFTSWGEMIFEDNERAEFMAWYDNAAAVIVACELMEVETTDTRPSGVKADPLAYWNGASLDGNAIRVTQFPSGLVIQGANTASPLDQPHKSTYDAGKRYAELVANGTEPAEAAHQVDVETAMADSRDSAGV